MKNIFSLNSEPIKYSTEFIGGLINFMAIAYIIIVNPIIMNANGLGFPIQASITATLLTVIVMTILAGFIIKLPFVIAPGMGINAIVTYTLVIHDKLPLATTLGVVFWSSVLMLIFSITPLRQKIIDAIPENLQIALSVGIGLFLIMIGFKNADVIISNPNTIIGMHQFNINIGLCFIGFILSTILFIRRKIYAMVLPIIIVTTLSFLVGKTHMPTKLFEIPDFSLFMSIDFADSLKLSVIPAILSLFIVHFFDATSSVVGLLSQINYKNQDMKNIYYKRSLATDALGGIASGIAGTSCGVIFIESATGIQNGARTGFASIITAILCIPFLFLSPLIGIIPNCATSPVLILVGILMMDNIRKIKFKHLEDFVSVILTVVMMPFCFSITAGAVFGITSYTLLKLLLGRFDDVSPALIMVAICCMGWFYLY